MEIVHLKKELSQRFARLDQRFAQMDQRFAQVDQRLARVDERFAQVEQRLGEVLRLIAADAERTRRHFDVVAGQMRDAAVAQVEEL